MLQVQNIFLEPPGQKIQAKYMHQKFHVCIKKLYKHIINVILKNLDL